VAALDQIAIEQVQESSPHRLSMRAINPTSSQPLGRFDIGRYRSQRLQSALKLRLFRLQPLTKNLMHLLAQYGQVIDGHGFPV
jgi:hypothetical protein